VRRPATAIGLAGALLLCPAHAPGQSERLLEATRLQRPGAAEMAQAELTACIKRNCPDAGRLSLLLGELLLSRGEPAQALAVLRRFPAPPPLGPYRDFALGEAYFYLRDYRAAAARFSDAAGASGAIGGRAEARAGEALLLAGEPGEALPLLERGLAQVGGPELLFARSEARAQLGDLAGAQADLHTLLVRYPRAPVALEVDAHLRGSSAPAVALTLEERLGRARAFLDAGDARQALAEVERIDSNGLARDAAGRAQLALFRAQSLYPLGRGEEGDAALEVAAQGPPATASEALLVRARRLLRLNDNAGALQKFQEVSRRFPQEIASEEADYFIGWIALQEGRIQAATQSLEAFEKRHPESRRRDDACWFRALAFIRLANWAEADRALRELIERYPKSTLVPQARYWRARVKHLSGGNAAEDYLEVLRSYPASFYALVAAERLRELGVKPPPLFAEKPRLPAQAPASPELSVPRALAAAGLWREAAEELRTRLGQVHTPEQALRVGTSLALIGNEWAAYGLANRLLWGRAYSQKDAVSLALLYPRPYTSHVDETARSAGVPPGLLYALMRRESAFRSDRLSAARARGLMQLMARTASAIAKELQLEPPEPDELYRPELNLDLSAWYVARLSKRFVHPALVAAAYNAGPTVTLQWATQYGQLPVDLFVESLPYKETRNYVKQVVADLYLYQLFYGSKGEPPRLAMGLPTPAPTGIDF